MPENRLMLTKDELVELTEYAQRSKQRQRLTELGVPFIPGRKGCPLVMRTTLEQLMLPARWKKAVLPDFGALNRS